MPLPPMQAARFSSARVNAPPPRRAPPVGLIVLLALGGAALVAIVGGLVVLPGIVRSRCIAAAADRGVALTIDSVSLGLAKVRLVKIGFKLDGVPQLTGAADAVDVALSGLTPSAANASGLAMTIDGPAEDVQTALDAWRAAQAKKVRGPAIVGGDSKISFAGAHVVWTRVLGESAKLEAVDAQGWVDGATNALTFTSEKVSLATPRATFGPWRATLERDAQGTRTHVEFDPVVHGGPQATYVRDGAGATSLKMSIPSEPLSRLGVPAKGLGLASDPTVEGSLDLEEAATGASTLKTSLALTKAAFSGLPVDARLDLSAAGDATKGLDVKSGTFTAGPLRATVTGTITLFRDGARAALAWRTTPVPCATLAKGMATQALGSLGSQLGALAEQVSGSLGVKVNGEALASGLVTVDSRDIAAATSTMTTNETCGLALF